MNVSLCDNCIFFPNACDGCPDICTFTPKREDKSNEDIEEYDNP